jgi:hypothetical protein
MTVCEPNGQPALASLASAFSCVDPDDLDVRHRAQLLQEVLQPTVRQHEGIAAR